MSNINSTKPVQQSAKVIELFPRNPTTDFYSKADLLQSPIGIYNVYWTVKNLMMHISACAMAGENVTNDLKQYNFMSIEDKEKYDLILIHHIHELMSNTLTEMLSYPNSSVDGLIAQTVMKFRGYE